MWCKRFGKTCVFVFDKVLNKPRFIRENIWLSFSDKELERYIW